MNRLTNVGSKGEIWITDNDLIRSIGKISFSFYGNRCIGRFSPKYSYDTAFYRTGTYCIYRTFAA